MCGIAGFFGRDNTWQDDINKMNHRMRHRGPDSMQFWHGEKDRITLGHTRLSIIDISETGNQPMHSKNGRYSIVLNGEIYNYRDLRKILENNGVFGFVGHSDTEVLVEYISEFGINKTLEDIVGMYAFAVFDHIEKKLFIARDRIGEKPLYYGFLNDSFIFASEIGALKVVDNSFELDKNALALYFRHGYIPAPYSIYKELKKLSPGCLIELSFPYKQGDLNIKKYWDIKQVAKQGEINQFQGSYQEAVEELDRLMRKSIGMQMVADVPVGAFLSGGIDSASVVSVMQQLSNMKVKTFTIGFEEDAYNEACYAKQIAQHIGTDHTELYVTSKDIIDVIPNLSYIYGEPYADSSQIPTYLVSRIARQRVTVSLSGDGGDELFCGYNSYKSVCNTWNKMNTIPQNLRNCAKIMNSKKNVYKNRTIDKIFRYIDADSPEEVYIRTGEVGWDEKILLEGRIPNYTYNLFDKGFLKGTESNIMLMDMMMYHPDDILTKVDRSAMAVSLESRVPLLDRNIVEFAWRLPLDYKRNSQEGKLILKDVLYEYVPKELMDRPKKGFSIPVMEWIRNGELKEWAEGLLNREKIYKEGILDYKEVEKTWNCFLENGCNANKVWYLLMFEEWMEKN